MRPRGGKRRVIRVYLFGIVLDEWKPNNILTYNDKVRGIIVWQTVAHLMRPPEKWPSSSRLPHTPCNDSGKKRVQNIWPVLPLHRQKMSHINVQNNCFLNVYWLSLGYQ